MRVVIDPDLCLKCGACTVMAPGAFVLDQKSGEVKVVSQSSLVSEEVKIAKENCPVDAIKIIDEQKGERKNK